MILCGAKLKTWTTKESQTRQSTRTLIVRTPVVHITNSHAEEARVPDQDSGATAVLPTLHHEVDIAVVANKPRHLPQVDAAEECPRLRGFKANASRTREEDAKQAKAYANKEAEADVDPPEAEEWPKEAPECAE